MTAFWIALTIFASIAGYVRGIYREDARAVKDGFLLHKGRMYDVKEQK